MSTPAQVPDNPQIVSSAPPPGFRWDEPEGQGASSSGTVSSTPPPGFRWDGPASENGGSPGASKLPAVAAPKADWPDMSKVAGVPAAAVSAPKAALPPVTPETIPQALRLTPSLPTAPQAASDDYQIHPHGTVHHTPIYQKTSFPEWLGEPMLPKVQALGERIDRDLGEGSEIDARRKALAAYDQNHPAQAGVAKGIDDFFNGMSTPENLGLMALLPESRVLSIFFAAQAAKGSYDNAEGAYQAFKEGRNSDAARFVTAAGLNAAMAGMAGAHAVRGPHAAAEGVGEESQSRPEAEAQRKADEKYEQSATQTASYAAARQKVEAGQPLSALDHEALQKGPGTPRPTPAGYEERQAAPTAAAPAAKEPDNNAIVTPGETVPPIGAKDEETGRTVLQASENPDVNQARATAEHPEVKQTLASAVQEIPGAKMAGARDEKDTDRLEEKIDGEGQSPETARDYSAFRIGVDSPEAHAQVVKALRQQFEVPEETDEFDKGADETGFHGHTMQVRAPGSPVTHEVQILPREVAEAAEDNHPLYEKARDGDKEAAAQLKAKNEQDWQRFQARNAAPGAALQNRAQNIPENIPRSPGADEKVRQGLYALLDKATRRMAMEQHGQAILDDMTDQGISPIDVSKRFWEHTYFNLPAEAQAKFQRYLKGETSFQPGDVIGTRADKTPWTAKDWADIAENILDLSDDPDHLEGTTRGLVAGMKEANDRFGGASQPINEGGIIQHGQPDILNRPTQEPKPRPGGGPTKYKFGSTQANLPVDSEAHAAVEAARATIPAADLAGDGKEVGGGNHVTVRYGIEGGDPAKLRAFIEAQAPFEARLGKTEKFEPTENSDGAAVIKAPVESPELRRINKEIAAHGDFKEPDFEYSPHVTIAYVKPEAADKYVGMTETEGKPFRVDSIAISNRDGSQEVVPLRGNNSERKGGRGESPEPLAGAEQTGAAPAGEAASQAGTVGAAKVADLRVDPKRFQYKLNTDSAGTTDLLKEQRWNPQLAGVISVWTDPADGRTYVVNGHHRFELARRNGVDSINVMRLRAPDAASARAIGALQNIAEGRGTPVDAAKFFRDSGYTPEEMKRSGISMGEATAANGVALSRLDDRLFDDVVSGKLRQGRAIAIGKATDVPAEQDAILTLIEKAESKGRRITDDTVSELARMAGSAGEHRETQTDLFGTTEKTRNLALEKAEASAYIRDQIGRERRLFSSVADQGKAERLSRGENVINAAKNAEIARSAAQAQELYDRLSTRSGPVDEILNRAARELAEGKEAANVVKSRAYEQARTALSEAVSGAAGSEPARLRGTETEAGRAPKPPARTEPAPSPGPTPELKPPRPPAARWQKGDTFLVRDPQGRWVAGTVEYYNRGVNGGKAGGRSRLSDGTKLDEVPAEARPVQSIGGKIPSITGSDLEREAIRSVEQDEAGYAGRYMADPKNNKDGVLTIATDAAKEMFPAFRADAANVDRDVAAPASRINKAVLKNALAAPVDPAKPEVQIMTASPGSGKTAGNMAGATADRTGLKVESILDDYDAASKLLNKILDSGRRPVVTWVYVDEFGKTVDRMFNRAIGHEGKPGIGRTVQLNYMRDAYKQIPVVLERLQREFGDRVDFRVQDNSGPKDAPKPPPSANLAPYIDDIRNQSYTDVRQSEDDKVQELRDKGLFDSQLGQDSLKAAQTTDRPDAQNPRGAGDSGREEGVGRGDQDLSGQPGLGSSLLESAAPEPGNAATEKTQEKTASAEENQSGAGRRISAQQEWPELATALERPTHLNLVHAKLRAHPDANTESSLVNFDAYAALAKRFTPGVDWKGVFLDSHQASRWVAGLRSDAARLRQTGMRAAADAANQLALALDSARDKDGIVSLLRPDHDESTIREEAAHRWMQRSGILSDEVVQRLAAHPLFDEVAEQLRAMHYDLDPAQMVNEVLAKALGGDPAVRWTAAQQNGVVAEALRTIAEEHGPRALEGLRKVDPVVAKAVEEARNGGFGGRSEEGGGGALRAGRGEAGAGAREGGQQGNRVSGSAEPAADRGSERGAEQGPAPEGKLGKPQFQRRLPGEQPLPGMEGAVREQDNAAAAQRGEDLATEMRQRGEDISRRTGEMERGSPLFRGTDANPQRPLFQRVGGAVAERPAETRATTVTTGNHDTGKSLREAVDELHALPDRKLTITERAEGAVDRFRDGVEGAKDSLAKTWAGVKGVSAAAVESWARPAPWSDYADSLGDLRKAQFRAAIENDDYQKALKRVAPSRREREAITAYGEAKDDEELKRWAAQADGLPNARYARAFKDALNLNDQQKAVARAQRRYYDEQLRLLKDAGLLPAGASHYAMHLFARDPEAFQQMLATSNFAELSENPRAQGTNFLEHRMYKSYFDAIASGETPATMDAGRILSVYHDAFTKTFMTRGFLRSLLYGTADEAKQYAALPEGFSVVEQGGKSFVLDPNGHAMNATGLTKEQAVEQALDYLNTHERSRPIAVLESRAGFTVVDTDKSGNVVGINQQPRRPFNVSDYVRIPATQLKNFNWELTDADRETLVPGYTKMAPEEQAKLFGPDDPNFPVPEGKMLVMKGDLLIHPDYAGRVSDLVTPDWLRTRSPHTLVNAAKATVRGVGHAGAQVKGLILYGSGFHQTQLALHGITHGTNPFKLASFDELAKNPEVAEGVRHGLNLLEVDPEGVLSDLPGLHTYHRYLFRDWIPRMKADTYQNALKRNMEAYSGKLTRDEVRLLTAKEVNNAYGGQDPAFYQHLSFMNNRTYKAVEHMLMFSPDFTKSRLGYVAQALGRYGFEQRRALLREFVLLYGTARLVNSVLNRKDGFWGAHWAPQDAFSIVIPNDPGYGIMADRRISPRSALTDALHLIESPKAFAYNRLNPVTLRPTIEFLTGRDNFGRQETKEHFFKNYAKQMTPIPFQKTLTTSDASLADSLLSAMGMSMGTYRTPLEEAVHKLYVRGIPDKPMSEEREDQARANVQEVLKLRTLGMKGDGEGFQREVQNLWAGVRQGKRSPRQVSGIVRRARMTELQYEVSHLAVEDALDIYEQADAAERQELHQVMLEKRGRGLAQMSPEHAKAIRARMDKLGIGGADEQSQAAAPAVDEAAVAQ